MKVDEREGKSFLLLPLPKVRQLKLSCSTSFFSLLFSRGKKTIVSYFKMNILKQQKILHYSDQVFLVELNLYLSHL